MNESNGITIAHALLARAAGSNSERKQVAAPITTLVAASAIWGVTYTLVKDATALYPAFSFLALRFALAWLVLVSLARVARERRRLAQRRERRGSVSLGALLAVGYTLHVLGLAETSATEAGFVTGLLVPMTALFAAVVLSERIGASTCTAAGLGVFGLVLVSGSEVSGAYPSLLLAGGAGCFALHIVFTRRFVEHSDPTTLARQQMLVCAVAFSCIAFTAEPLSVPDQRSIWVAVVITGALGGALAYTLQTWAQRRTTAARTSLALASEPVFAAAFATLVAGEQLGLVGVAGCFAILAGIVVSDESVFARFKILPFRRSQAALEARSNREWREQELAL